MSNNNSILRGTIWKLKKAYPLYLLDKSKTDIVLAISSGMHNNSAAPEIIALPISYDKIDLSWLIQADPETTGLEKVIYINCSVIHTIPKEELENLTGQANAQILGDIDYRLRLLLDL